VDLFIWVLDKLVEQQYLTFFDTWKNFPPRRDIRRSVTFGCPEFAASLVPATDTPFLTEAV